MKLLLENWRKYLNEEIQFKGILKLTPPPEVIEDLHRLMKTLPEEAVPMEDKNLHVTLAHQSVLRPHRSHFKGLLQAGQLPEPPDIRIQSGWSERADDELGRKSWVVVLENQDEMRFYINQIMEMVGGEPDPEPNRVFHISLANLTGNPGDSVR